MSAPRWIDKLKGLLQREPDPKGGELTSVGSSAAPEPARPAPAVVHTPVAAAIAPAYTPAPSPAPQPVAVKPKRPAAPPIPTINSRALAEFGMKQVAAVGTQLVQFGQVSKFQATPGLEHDLALILTGYVMVIVAMRVNHGEASQEAQRITRTNMKAVLLSVLRKSYAKANTDEAKLGANMVVYVDDLLDGADSVIAALQEGVKNGAPKFSDLSGRLSAPFNADPAAFEKNLADQYARVSAQIARVPKD